MPIDASIIPTKQTLPNFGAINQTAGGIIDTQRGLLGLAQLRQQQEANAAATQAFQQATDQQGNLDVPKALQMLSQNPNVGMYLPQFAGQLQGLRNTQLEGQNKQFDLAQKQLGFWDSQLGALYSKKNLTNDDVINSLSMGIRNGMITPQQAQSYAAEIPSDPSQLKDWVKGHYVGLMDAKTQLQAIMPQTQQVNTGGAVNILNIDPLTGQPKVAGTLLNSMSPGEAATPVQLTSPEGTPYAITKGQFANQAMGGMQGGMQGGNVPMGGVQTGLSPQEQARQATSGAELAKTGALNANDLSNSVADAPVRMNYLQEALNIVRDPNAKFGPGSDVINTAKGLLNTLSPSVAKAIGYDKDANLAQEFGKIMTNYASTVSGQVGGGTDARLNAAIMGNANPKMGNQANEDILVKALAAENLRKTMDAEWQNSPYANDPSKFNQWRAQFNKQVDPAVFALPYMSDAQKQKFLQSMKPAQLNQFKQSLANAMNSGWVQP